MKTLNPVIELLLSAKETVATHTIITFLQKTFPKKEDFDYFKSQFKKNVDENINELFKDIDFDDKNSFNLEAQHEVRKKILGRLKKIIDKQAQSSSKITVGTST